MKRASASPLAVAIGTRLRALREHYGKRQDEIAASARRWGLRWTRATVAAIETGRRQLSIGEFLLLPYALSQSWIKDQPELADTGRYLELADLLPDEGWIALTTETSAHSEVLRAILSGRVWKNELPADLIDTPQDRRQKSLLDAARAAMPQYLAAQKRIWSKVWPEAKLSVDKQFKIDVDSCRDAEQKAAHKLEVSPLAVSIAAHKLWKHSLTEERDRRIAEEASAASSPRTLQALRGHVTRTLLIEIEPLVVGTRGESLPAQPG